MLNRLRWQLTLLYLLAACFLVLLVGAGSYALLNYYFENETDQALEYRMARLFEAYQAPLPAALASAERTWVSSSHSFMQSLAPRGEPEEEAGEGHPEGGSNGEEYLDASLASIFILEGEPAAASNVVVLPLVVDQAALQAAQLRGYDRRTVSLPNGSRVRLLSYRTGGSGAIPPVLQIGRLLSDQQRILRQFLVGLLILGATAVLALGWVSWWLSGRSLKPAQRAWEQQQAFVSNASHELRTPLTLIRASAEYGLRARPPEVQSQVLRDILDEDEYMNKLVDDLLLLSRLDSRRLELRRERVDLPPLLEEVSRQVGKVAAERGVKVVLSPLQGAAWADPTRLRQVLLILLDNSLRFTPSGGEIRISAGLAGKYQQIRIADTGRGIPPEHLPHIFERFYQAPRSDAEAARSNGLGLSIARSLVEAQGGKISLESQVGKGTTAVLSLPAA